MEILTPSSTAINTALEILKSGGIVAHATETCYGLACDMTNPEAVEKLFRIKNRPKDQPVSALFSSLKATKEWVEWNAEALELAKKELPGPLTMILPLKKSAQEKIFPIPNIRTFEYSNTIGIRVSPHPVAQELSKKFRKPLSTTSANVSGNPPPYSAEEIQRQFSTVAVEDRNLPLRWLQPDLILDSGELKKVPPSKVISFEGGTMKVIRE